MFRLAIRLLLFLLCLAGVAARAEVIGLGYPGANTAELDARFDSVLKLHPDWVVIFAGANDALNPQKFLAPDTSRKNLQDMLTRSHNAGVHVLVVSVHTPDLARLLQRHRPDEYGSAPPERRVAAFNRMLERLAQQNNIGLVDFNRTMHANGGPSTALSTDGLHLTRAGYALLASAVRAKLPANLPASAKVVCFGDSLTYGIGVRAPGSATESDDTYPAQLRALLRR
ncbi:MAG TPA: GDSL-type esterase/lipase family protein [Acidobacteriaceae bacterium]|jgi:acyl-CoA thioesterase-1